MVQHGSFDQLTNVAHIDFKHKNRPHETDEQIWKKLEERFNALSLLTRTTLEGTSRALIVSGPAGLGKSYTIEEHLKEWDPDGENYTIIKGFVRSTGLYKILYKYRHRKNVIAFDDADSIFFDDVSLNMLKAVCDTTETRRLNYLAETRMETDEGDPLPTEFEFDGSIIFITNLDFDKNIEGGSKLAPHLLALMSRAHYVDMAMKTKRDYFVRIKQVIAEGMLQDILTKESIEEVVKYIETHMDDLRELSLRMALKIGMLRKSHPNKWKQLTDLTCLKE